MAYSHRKCRYIPVPTSRLQKKWVFQQPASKERSGSDPKNAGAVKSVVRPQDLQHGRFSVPCWPNYHKRSGSALPGCEPLNNRDAGLISAPFSPDDSLFVIKTSYQNRKAAFCKALIKHSGEGVLSCIFHRNITKKFRNSISL